MQSGSIKLAVQLFTRSLAAVVCLYMLILTTLIRHIICILQRLRVPAIIINLMVLIYNNIFVGQKKMVAMAGGCSHAVGNTNM